MLVLTRKVGQKIVIDDAICITVVAIQGAKVRLGVTAPPDIRVDRSEIHERRWETATSGLPSIIVSASEGG